MKRTIFILSFLVIVFLCSFSVQAESNVQLNMTDIVMAKGDSCKIKLIGTEDHITWKSTKKKIATVSDGVIKARKCGTTYIIAKASGQQYRCKVSIQTSRKLNDKVTDVYNWACDDIWNKGFCDIGWYVNDGTDSCGESLDLDKTIARLKKSLQNKEKYNGFMNKLQGKKYKKIKKTWNTMYREMGKLENIIDNEKPRHSKDYEFPNGTLSDCVWTMWDEIYDLK